MRGCTQNLLRTFILHTSIPEKRSRQHPSMTLPQRASSAPCRRADPRAAREDEKVAGKASSVPRAARGAACGRRHVGQHVSDEDVQGNNARSAVRHRRADSSMKLDKICDQKKREQTPDRGEKSQP